MTKSVSAAVVTPDTVGEEFELLQELTAVAGSPAAGSNGVVLSAPLTPKDIPEADVGVVDRLIVMVSAVSAVAAFPYHST